MKKILFVWAVALLTGCSTTPKVIADVTEQLPSQPMENVAIYDTDKSVPVEAKAIGKVSVTDGGMTPAYKCLYGNMLALAVRKTADSGGNVLHIDEHRTPSFWTSNCHRIWGTMYLMPDSLVDGNAQSVISQLEEEKDKELLAMAQEQIERREKALDNPGNIFKVNVGPSWITSEMQTPTKTYKNETGIALELAYQHFWRSGIGIGFNYLYHTTSFDEGYRVHLHYFGPNIVYGIKLGDNWRMDGALGLGYSVYKEDFKGFTAGDSSESNVGFLAQLGIEYMLSKSIGIGIQINSFTMSMKRPDGIDTSKYDFYGIKRFDAQLGFRFYL
jgi:opacity protein-like surface antigen